MATKRLLGELVDDADGPLFCRGVTAYPPLEAPIIAASATEIAAIYARCETADEHAAIVLTAALARMHVPAATAALFDLLVTPNPIARRIAASVLMRTGEPKARDVVQRMSREDPDPVVRSVSCSLAQGTEESRRRLLAGLEEVWPFRAELVAAYDATTESDAVLDQVLDAAGVDRPEAGPMSGHGHTEALSRMLAEMQVVARAHPRGRW